MDPSEGRSALLRCGTPAGRLARAVSGVVDVINLLDRQYDDSAELKRRYVFDAQVGPTVRWPT
jgi:hypothetical protein